MNNNQTITKLRQMRLTAMAVLHEQQIKDQRMETFTPDEYVGLLTDYEWEHRQNTRISRLMKQAHFKQKASLPEISYSHNRNLDKNSFQRLGTLEFIGRSENIIITGPAGVGKSYLAQALGNQACMMSYKVRYANTKRLFSRLQLCRLDGSYLKELQKLSKTDLLILDDFGLQSLDNQARESLMDIIDDRYNNKSTIISSQIPVSSWYGLIGEGTIADAILDRIVNSSHRITLQGESLRKRSLNNRN